MTKEKDETYLVSKNFDRFFMAYLVLGGIAVFLGFPLLAILNS